MPSDFFQQAVAFTLGQEGGWCDNPADPGGATMHGITLAVFRAWRRVPGATSEELRAISPGEIEAIYRALYWNPTSGSHLSPGVGLAVFDTAVNLGVRRAAVLLQITLGVVQDGAIGPQTLGAAARATPGKIVRALASEREAFYRRCEAFPVFGRGWLARNRACTEAALTAAQLSGPDVQALRAPMARRSAPVTANDLNAGELARLSDATSGECA